MSTSPLLDREPADLANCDQEPIHIPGSIQPHGLLFVLREPDLNVLQVSENTSDLLGLAPDLLLGIPFSDYLPDEQAAKLERWLKAEGLARATPFSEYLDIGRDRRRFEAIAHRTTAGVVLELEPTDAPPSTRSVATSLEASIECLQDAVDTQVLCRIAVEQVRRMTGFDRVMMYRFDPNWHGSVIAEARADHMESYKGLHFPATDIPVQARRLYTTTRLRLIVNATYTPARLISQGHPSTQSPLDLSRSILRSVSPIHLKYLRNMGVHASMSVSIVQNGKLWGLIACHHAAPYRLPYAVRSAAEILGQVVSMLLATRQDAENKQHTAQLKDHQSRLLEEMIRADDYVDGLIGNPEHLLGLAGAQGAAFYNEGTCTMVGKTPSVDDIRKIAAWLSHSEHADAFHTDALPRLLLAAEAFKDVASGLLAVALSRLRNHYVFWFRPEQPRTVYWAGNPEKAVRVTENGTPRLHPRSSFSAWKETLQGRAEPWQPAEIEAARALRQSITDVVMVKTEQLARLNRELEARNEQLRAEVDERRRTEDALSQSNRRLQQSNRELQDFAYVASHDLQEPLRKIRSFADLVKTEYAGRLDDSGRHFLSRMQDAAERMSMLISDLLAFSRVATHTKPFRPVKLNSVVQEALVDLEYSLDEAGAQINVDDLPEIEADAAQLRRLFQNLLSNAIKFRKEEAPPRIHVRGRLVPGDVLPSNSSGRACRLEVMDNGIGFDEKYLDRIFQPFQRLHARGTYMGTGIGLAICRRIAERHNGTLSAVSTPGEGSTFIVTLPARQPD